MLEIASEITLCLLLAALIGFILGFIVAKSTGKKSHTKEISKKDKAPAPKESIEEEIETLIANVSEEETENDTNKPILLDTPRENKKDTLTQIKGIGPKVEEQLNATGIYHFEQIANWSEANIQWLEGNTTFAHRAKKDLWVNQAKSLI
jgi:NADH-quinone oxidoreductase subunit E